MKVEYPGGSYWVDIKAYELLQNFMTQKEQAFFFGDYKSMTAETRIHAIEALTRLITVPDLDWNLKDLAMTKLKDLINLI